MPAQLDSMELPDPSADQEDPIQEALDEKL
jgi:hypothetical protein